MSTMNNEINIDMSYDIVKLYYNEKLNRDSNLVETSNDEPTPIDCVEEMIGKIPEEFWKDENIKILDPCCGCGNFGFVIYHKLLKYHTKEHILSNILYFNDINIKRIDVLKSIFNVSYLNVYTEDFLEFNPLVNCRCIDNSQHKTLTFDLVVANPPYAKLLSNGRRASKNHNMIGSFIRKSFELLNKKGLLLYITPDNWMSYADRNTLILELTQKQIQYINIHTAKQYFKKIGSSFVWYLIENVPYYKDIEIDGIWKKQHYHSIVKSEKRHYIPLFYNYIIQSILHKTIDANNEKFKVETSSNLHKYTKRSLISAIQDETHIYKLIHTPKQTVWSSVPHKFQEGYKVFIPTTTYYSSFIDNCGMTQSIAFIRCNNEEEANNICRVLQHPLYRFVNNICRYGNFNNIRILQQFPKCNDYNSVYSKFNITTEEIAFIETYEKHNV